MVSQVQVTPNVKRGSVNGSEASFFRAIATERGPDSARFKRVYSTRSIMQLRASRDRRPAQACQPDPVVDRSRCSVHRATKMTLSSKARSKVTVSTAGIAFTWTETFALAMFRVTAMETRPTSLHPEFQNKHPPNRLCKSPLTDQNNILKPKPFPEILPRSPINLIFGCTHPI